MLFCESPSDMTVAIGANLFLHLSLTLIIHFSSERTKELLFKVRQFDDCLNSENKHGLLFYPPPLHDTQFKKTKFGDNYCSSYSNTISLTQDINVVFV